MENIRYCKKCGCELSSFSKGKKCDNCRRKTAKTIRNVICGVFAVGLGGAVYNNTISNNDSEGENSEERDA